MWKERVEKEAGTAYVDGMGLSRHGRLVRRINQGCISVQSCIGWEMAEALKGVSVGHLCADELGEFGTLQPVGVLKQNVEL